MKADNAIAVSTPSSLLLERVFRRLHRVQKFEATSVHKPTLLEDAE